MERTCLDCEHFRFDTIHDETEFQYSSGGFDCAKRHYSDVQPFDTAEVRVILRRARQCDDFTPEK